MARTISQASLDKLAETHAVEPVLVIEIAWALGGTPIRYATKDISVLDSQGVTITVPGKVVEVGNIDSVVAVSMNESSEEVSLILDDRDGSIKEIMNLNDIMLRDVKVYQWFEGIDFDERFLIFQGKINSPIRWSETDRTVKFDVISQLEDNEVGFSPEEGEFPDLPDEMIGKVWPECFGTSVHQQMLQIDKKHTGSLGDGCGIADFTLPSRAAALTVIEQFLNSLFLLYAIAAGFAGIIGLDDLEEQLEDKANSFALQRVNYIQQRIDVNALYAEQLATECTTFRVIGGEWFPRGGLTLDINGAKFVGSFGGALGVQGSDTFFVSESIHPEAENYPPKVLPFAEGFGVQGAPGGDTFFIPTGQILGDQAGAFFAQAGSSVKIATNEPLRYVVSVTPGVGGINGTGVLKVAAFATFESGERVLVDVPSNLYNVFQQNYGSVTATIVQVTDALSKQTPPWEDTLYVTFQSSVGPNPIDIMQYLIQKYTDFPVDTVSFDACRVRLANYPMHFCLTQKKNILTVLQELAYMSRTAISLKVGSFFCRYLPEKPPSVHEFNLDNVVTQSVELSFTDTEDLVTKFKGAWRAHGAQDKDNEIVLRYNVKKYGTHEDTFDFYAYNFLDIVIKVMTFWIIRRGNTWKKLKFQAGLDALNVETFDGVNLNFDTDWASDPDGNPLRASIEQADYNFGTNQMDITAWTGVRSGEMTPYDFAYPADVSEFLTFPTPPEEAAGFAGSNGPGKDASGNIAQIGGGNTTRVTFGNQADDPYSINRIPNRATTDKGTSKPSDVGDKNPGSPIINTTGNLNPTLPPPATTDIPVNTIPSQDPIFFLDIRTTKFADSDNPGQTATLDTFFREITDNTLKGNTTAKWTDGTNDSEFDFKYDDTGNKWGAGTAFLQE